MPSLTTVTLKKRSALRHKESVHTKSSSSSSPSFLDITPALQYYLQFIVSFTRHSHPNTKSPFSLHTTIAPFPPHYHSFSVILYHDIKHSFKPILSFHSNSRDRAKQSLFLQAQSLLIVKQWWIRFLLTEYAVASLSSLSLVDPASVMGIPCITQHHFHHSEYYRLCLIEMILTINSKQGMQLL